MNSGDWNFGYGNLGYLCTRKQPIYLFNKPVPKGWDYKFPNWMYFNLISEGYKASWQEAFKNASIEGVKKLIALPNFDFKIFEEISSITEEQIRNKKENCISRENNIKNWDGKLYKVLVNGESCHGGEFEWSLPEDGKPGEWTPIISDAIMCEKGYHLTTHYAHWSDKANMEVYEAEGDVVEFDGYDKVVCSRARLLRRVENPFSDENNNSGSWNSGRRNSGYRNSGHRNSGYRNSGDNNSGNYNSGNWNSGRRNSGYRNSGSNNSGHGNSGSFNSGDYNSGNYNSGRWNSGDWNSGYLCTQTPPIYLFNKPAPEGWDGKFPNWAHFELLPEGYKASWQEAFKNASIEGVKELINLPNFDSKIFEEISSITEEQIRDKLMSVENYMVLEEFLKGEKRMDLNTKTTEVVENFCNNLESFTSLDISNKVKCTGFSSVRHREIAHIVRVLFADGVMEDYGFKRTIINVTLSNGTIVQAYLYHHQGVSPDSYNHRSQTAIKPQDQQGDNFASVAPISTPTSVGVVNSNNSVQSRRQKGDCRLEVPASWVRHLGWNEGSTIYAVRENGITLKNSNNVSPTDDILTTIIICDGRLRVPKTAFIKAGFVNNAPGILHDVHLEADKILISELS
jgi:hypothetical protein